ncbi:uncharacterized protein ACJ7VT_020830 [Polymixia lowei]
MDEVEDIKMEDPYQSMSDEFDSTDDSATYEDGNLEFSSSGDEDERNSSAYGDEELECVDELSDKGKEYYPDDTASDSDSESSSSGTSSDSSYTVLCSKTPTSSIAKTSMCTECGKGPFRNVNVHLLHCKGRKTSLECAICNERFPTEKSLLKHEIRLYACDLCNEVFNIWNSYRHHRCPKGNKPSDQPTIILRCYALMPNKCNVCKTFYSTESSLLEHIVAVHTTKVTTKVCMFTKPSAMTVKTVSPIDTVSATEAQLAPASSGLVQVSKCVVNCQTPSAVNQIVNGKPSVGQPSPGSLPTLVQSTTSQPGCADITSELVNGGTTIFRNLQQMATTVTHVAPQKSVINPQVTVTTQDDTVTQPLFVTSKQTTTPVQFIVQSSVLVRPSSPKLLSVPATAVRPGTAGALGQAANQPPRPLCTPVSVPVGSTNTTSATVARDSATPLMPPLSIVSMFKNDSRDLALKRRTNTSRPFTSYPCWQCGAKEPPSQPSIVNGKMCTECGRGPFRNVKVHLLHCTGKKIHLECSVCNQRLPEKSLLNYKLRKKVIIKPQVTVTTREDTVTQPLFVSSETTTPVQFIVQSLPDTKLPVCSIPVGPGTAGALGQVANQPPRPLCTPVSVPVSSTRATSATVACDSPPTPPLSIVSMFKNDSRKLALKRRTKAGWRSKAPYLCRQCGAISRQPSLIVSHRYLHRGHRTHRCQCGRTFLHRLHLLRHCVQHAETTSYICE